MEREKIVAVLHCVRKHLQDSPLRDLDFVVSEEDVRMLDGWLHALVRPTRMPKRMFELNVLMVEVNLAIQDEFGNNILLVLGSSLHPKEYYTERRGEATWIKPKRTKRKAAATVQKYLDSEFGRSLEDNVSLHADARGVILGDKWVRVPVRPSREPDRMFVFYEFLNEINSEVVEKENYNFILTTGDPLYDATAEPAATHTTSV